MHPWINGTWIDGATLLAAAFIVGQLFYSATLLIDLHHVTRPVSWVRMAEVREIPERDYPEIVLFYPVLREPESTLRATLLAIGRVRYPAGKARIIAVPNQEDAPTVASLRRLQDEFDFLEVMPVPPTRDPSWELILDAWQDNEKCYWWHDGRRAYDRDLPPGKARQLIYAVYHTAAAWRKGDDFLVNYVDADSCPPPDHFMAAVAGMRHYDVLQSRTLAGNPDTSLAAGLHALDHLAWDGMKYPRLSGDGRHPFWLQGKGLFFRASDLIELGGFHPWIALEAPEVGLRFWKNGRRLGAIREAVIEQAPLTFRRGIAQRKRWVCGALQSLAEPLDRMNFTFAERCRAWLNVLPCLSLWINVIAMPTAVWAAWAYVHHRNVVPPAAAALACANLAAFVLSFVALYLSAWRRTRLVLPGLWRRLAYMLRINPVFVAAWWVIWLAPLTTGLVAYLRERGEGWEQTGRTKARPARVAVRFAAAHNAHPHRAARVRPSQAVRPEQPELLLELGRRHGR